MTPPTRWPLSPTDSVGALIVTQGPTTGSTTGRRFLLQRRDDIPQIWYPGRWGLFGGGIDPGETEREALARELKEELDFDLIEASHFTQFSFDFGFAGGPTVIRSFYEVPVDARQAAGLRLLEGQALGWFDADQVLAMADLIGYEQFALYLYIHRDRITIGPVAEPNRARRAW